MLDSSTWLRPIAVKGWFEGESRVRLLGERWKKGIVGVWGRGMGEDRRMWEGLLGYLYDDVVSDPFVRAERIPETKKKSRLMICQVEIQG